MHRAKILSINEIGNISKNFKRENKKIVLCHGTFDLIHTGHIRYFTRAKEEGDILIVTVTADQYVNKGPERPYFKEELRAENIAALQAVDYVGICYDETAIEAIETIRPDLYVKGSDYKNIDDDITGNIRREKNAVERCGGDIFFTDEITFSSSSILNENFDIHTPETKEYLRQFKRKWNIEEVLSCLEKLQDLKVLVIGDAIIDEYHYVSILGHSGKGNVLAVEYENEEQFAGGSIAVANHISRYVKSVDLVTGIGREAGSQEFIEKKLEANVTPYFQYFSDAPTVKKRRFVDNDFSKLFEIYFYKDNSQIENEGLDTLDWLKQNLEQYDLVVSSDFGNGFISPQIVNILSDKAKFLAVNTQINSGNRGYHAITRYPRADFISLNEPELRLAGHDNHSPLDELSTLVGNKLNAKNIAVTRGTRGVFLKNFEKEETSIIPALSSRVIDRIGAGDAFLSLSSLAISKEINHEIAGFVGAVAAAIDVQIICNREPVDPVSLKKFITMLLK